MTYAYKKTDNFWDIESLKSMFTIGFYYPTENYMILSYIDDNNIIDPTNIEEIKAWAYRRNPNFHGDIYLEDLTTLGSITQPGKLGIQTFVKRMGFTKNGFDKNSKANNQVINGSKDTRDIYRLNGRLEVPEAYYPVKDTDPEYNADEHGFFFGYNTTQYDLTMLAYFMTNLGDVLTEDNPERKLRVKDGSDGDQGEILTAYLMRKFNDQLFSPDFKSNMPSRLAYPDYNPNDRQNSNIRYMRPDYKTEAWQLRKAWLYTNRYIDIARLNEKMFRVGLKRLLGMLGHQILEFQGLSNGKRIKDKVVAYKLIAYNFSDVINLRWLFEHKIYQNNFALKQSLLKDYPETVYQRKGKVELTQAELAEHFSAGTKPPTSESAPYEADINYRRVSYQRLTIDSTSAKFVEMVIAPYNKMTDHEVVSFMYPSPAVAKQLSKELGYEIVPTDILEDTKTWFEEHVAKPGSTAHDEFMNIYNFYDGIRGRNFNVSDKYAEDYGTSNHTLPHPAVGNEYVKDLMKQFNTNLFYFNTKGEPTSCLANFSIGGIHGAEIDNVLYREDIEQTKIEYERLQFVKDLYDGDALAAINGSPKIINYDGEEEKVRAYMKSGSTRAKAEWKEVAQPELFKKKDGVLKINKKYSYVSVGPSQHEDFTSYYPLMLNRLSVFMNPERGPEANPYFDLFERRYAKKKEANDRSLSDEVRYLANLVQDSMKLLLNAATGAADATFDNNIRMNNAIMAMRIIGQLFAWRIGQAQTLAGARVPSTNTDGLYTMDLDEETNARILEEVSHSMYIGIEPEPLTRFVTKDSNNRMEVEDGKIISAKGGALNSWEGPQPTQSLDHPSAVDCALAYYLRDHEDPANSPFDYDLAKKSFSRVVQENKHKPVEIMRHFQWIMSSSAGTNQFIFLQAKNQLTGQVLANTTVQHYNRIFLMKSKNNTITTPFVATKRKVNANTAKKRMSDGLMATVHDPIAKQILEENGFDWKAEADPRDEAKVMKVKNMPTDQHVYVHNEDLHELSVSEMQKLISSLDVEAYIGLLQKTFENSWSNVA